MGKRWIRFIGIFAFGLCIAQSVHAQRAWTNGLHGGVSLQGSSWDTEDAFIDERGLGLGFMLGYGFGHRLALYVQMDGAWLYDSPYDEESVLGHFDLGLQYFLLHPRSAARPYLDVAVTGLANAWTDWEEGYPAEAELTGGGLTLGGGVRFRISRNTAFNLGLKATFAVMDEMQIDHHSYWTEEMGAVSTRANAGLVWYFGR